MRRLKIISIVMLLSIVALLPKSNAALVSKPGTSPLVNTTVSNSYLLCQKMKGLGESLYGAGSNVQPHLATNKDWGAVSYLSNSIYGTNTKGGDKGLKVTIDGREYYSTNGNTSGVMNWGTAIGHYAFVQTAGLINSYNNSTSVAKDYVRELYDNRNTKYVDYIDPRELTETLGMATSEWNSRFNSGVSNDIPTSIRTGLFSGAFSRTDGSVCQYATGAANSYNTFRPVVWN